jgi:hypothetical protein
LRTIALNGRFLPSRDTVPLLINFSIEKVKYTYERVQKIAVGISHCNADCGKNISINRPGP